MLSADVSGFPQNSVTDSVRALLNAVVRAHPGGYDNWDRTQRCYGSTDNLRYNYIHGPGILANRQP